MESNRIEIKTVGDNKVEGFIDSTRVISLHLSMEGKVTCNVSSCIPHKFPVEYINVYQSCLSVILRLRKLRFPDGGDIGGLLYAETDDERLKREVAFQQLYQRIEEHEKFGLGFALCHFDFDSTRTAIKREQEKLRELLSNVKSDRSLLLDEALRHEREMTIRKVRDQLDAEGLTNEQIDNVLNAMVLSNLSK